MDFSSTKSESFGRHSLVYDELVSQVSLVENEESVLIEYGESKQGEYILCELKGSEAHISFNVCITKEQVDMYLGQNGSPYFEMATVDTPKLISEFRSMLYFLLHEGVREVYYSSGRIEYVNSETGKVMYHYSPILRTLFGKGSVVDAIEYNPWLT